MPTARATRARAAAAAAARAQQQQQESIANFDAEGFSTSPHRPPQPQQPEAGETRDDESSSTPSNVGQQEGDDDDDDNNALAAVDDNNHDTAAAAPAPVNNNAPSNRLVRIRENFNAAGVRKKARSKSTYDGHQRNNLRLIVYLYEKNTEMLVDQLRHQLDDVNADPDYTDIVRRHPQYVRRGGKKSLNERKEEFRIELLKDVISDAIGSPGTSPSQQVIDFDAFTEDADVFVDYLTQLRKADGALNKAGSYLSHRSSLKYLFRRYKYTPSRAFEEDLKECVEGIKRSATEACQAGEGNIYDGDRALTWPLYLQFNRWFAAMGGSDGIFACAFAKMCMGLACRSINTTQVCIKHMKWEGDAIEIPFAHSKEAQAGTNRVKKLPRSLHGNPLQRDADLFSSLFDYLALNPEELHNPEQPLFGVDTQKFRDIVNKIKLKYKTVIEDVYGFKIDDIGVHSWRKGAHTRINTGSTAGPSSAASNIRCGHAMGIKDLYVALERDSDGLCSRLTAGLNINSPEFGVSFPKFLGIDTELSLREGRTLSDAEIATQQVVVDGLVRTALCHIFGEETLENHRDIMPILRVGLASHLIHRDSYDELLEEGKPESGKLLPDDSPLRCTPLFTNPIMNQLKKWVHIAMPWEDHYEKYFQKATGIPPHVVLMAYIKGMQADISGLTNAVQNIPSELDRLLERRQMAGPLSLESIVDAVQNGPVMTGMARDVARLTEMLTDGGQLRTDGSRNTSNQRAAHNMRLVTQYRHADGEYRRVPRTWTFPSLHLQNMYTYWHCGDEESDIPPMKMLETKDVKFLNRGRKKLSEIRCVMKFLDNAAASAGLAPRERMTNMEAIACYRSSQPALCDVIPDETPTGRKREKYRMLEVGTVYKFITKKN